MSKIVMLGNVVAATLIAGAVLGAPARAQQPGPGGTDTATAPPKPQATGVCRVQDYVGGRTCTGDVPEAACAAIAREAKGQYTWTQEECP